MRNILLIFTLAMLLSISQGMLIRPDQINTSQPFPSILMDDDANISLDGGKIKNFRSEPDIGIRSFVQINKPTGRVMMRESSGEWACVGDVVLTSCCVLNSENIVGFNSSGACWKWNGEEWMMLSDSPVLGKCSIGSDGTLCAVASGNGLYKWDGDSWVSIGGAVVSLAVLDATHIYMVGADHTTYGHLWMYDGETWVPLDTTTEIDSVSVAKDGSLFAILHSGGLSKWAGTAWGSSLGGVIKAIAAKSGTMVWVVGADDTLWYWNGLTWTQSDPGIAVSDISISNF